MKKFSCIILFILLSTQTIFAGSLVDSIADKIFDSIGGTALEQKAKEFESLLPKLEQWQQALESIDTDKLGKDMLTATFRIYKEYGCPYVPSNYESMSYTELNEWSNKYKNELDQWVDSLPQSTQDEMNTKGEAILKEYANPVIKIAESGMPVLNEMQGKMTEIEPLLDNYVNGYKNFMKSYEDGTLDLSKYPEWQQAMDLMKPMAEAYAKGDKIQAFKYLDDITGLFSNSEAFQGLKILLESADAVGLGKYMAKIFTRLLKFNGTDLGISESQMEQVWNEYIKEWKQKTGVKSNAKYADKIKGMLEGYLGNIDSMEKTTEALGKFADSPAGDFIKKQLAGKGYEALEDVMSKYSGVDKQTIRHSGIMDVIKDTTEAVAEAGVNGGGFDKVATSAFDKILKFLGFK